MTMYLSNREIRPTGYELVEYIDDPPASDDADVMPLCRPADDEQEGSS
jgi:hypothetical protein